MNFTWLYIGALYAAAVFLARRAGAALPKRVALFFYALVLLFFFRPLTQDFVNFQVDVVARALPPWYHMTNDHHQYTSELNDLPMQIVPWMHQVRESWKSLTPPLWNHLSGSGYPLLGNGQSSALSLLRFLALPLPLPHAVTAEAAMKVLLALTFTFLFCRRRYSLLASVIAAVTFGFCGFIVGWLHFPMVTAACLAPAVLYCVDLLAERRSFGRFVFAAAVWTQLLFAGHPETAAHLFWLAAMYVLWLAFVERTIAERLRFFGTLAGVMVVATLLSAPYLMPLLETIPKSKRVAELKADPLDADKMPYTDRNSALVMFQPHFFGQVPMEKAWGPADTEPLGGYPGVFAWAAWLAVALHVVVRRAWRSAEAFFALVTLFMLGVIFGWPGAGELLHAMMPIAAHARVRLLFALLVAIQSAAAIDLARRVPLLAGIAVVAAMLLVLLYGIPEPLPYRFDTRVLAMLPSVGVLLAATWLAMSQRRAAVLALLVAVTAELFSIGQDRPTPLPARQFYPSTPMIAKLQELMSQQKEPFRVAGIGPTFFPNINALYGIEDIRAHDPMANARYLAFLKLTADYEPWNYFAWLRNQNKPVYDFLNVRYLLLDPNATIHDPDRYALVYDGKDGRIVENRRVLPRFYAVRNVLLEFRDEVMYPQLRAQTDWAGTAYLDALELETEQQHGDFFNPRPANAPLAVARITSATPTDYRLHVKAPRWSLVASSVPWWPGWVVERNGERIPPIRVNAVFLGFAVPPGESEVRVRYAPWTWRYGVGVALLTVVGLVGVAVHSSRAARRISGSTATTEPEAR